MILTWDLKSMDLSLGACPEDRNNHTSIILKSLKEHRKTHRKYNVMQEQKY